MTENHDLARELRVIAQDAPDESNLLSDIRTGYRRRLSRRRFAAAGSVAAVVLVVTGATTLMIPTTGSSPGVVVTSPTATAGSTTAKASVTANASTAGARTVTETDSAAVPDSVAVNTRDGGSGGLPTLGSRTQKPVTAPAGGRLVPLKMTTAVSPVSVPPSWVSFAEGGASVSVGPTWLEVSWAGKSPTVLQTVDDATGATGTGKFRGYLITKETPAVEVDGAQGRTRSTRAVTTVNGHAAELLTAPKGSFDSSYQTPAAERLAWQLGDGRWIQAWAAGESTSVLESFAAAITDAPVEIPLGISTSLTVAGLTLVAGDNAPWVSQMHGPSLQLCPPGTAVNSIGFGTCLTIYSAVADASFLDGVISGQMSQAEFLAKSSTVDVAGLSVMVNVQFQTAWLRWGAASVRVTAPTGYKLSAKDLASLAAAVQLSPDLGVKDEPNPMVESSLAQASAQSASTAGSK